MRCATVGGRAALGAVLVALAGCAGARARPAAAESVHIANVPFFPDNTDQCGPSTLASVLTFWNRPTTPADLKAELYLPKLHGTLPMDLLPAVEKRGLAARVENGSLDSLKENLRAGRPVLAYLDFGLSRVMWGHYVVVTGFDAHGVYVHSGKKPQERVSYHHFAHVWNRTDRWMLVVTGPLDKVAS